MSQVKTKEIVKPDKQLRFDLQQKKVALELKGWEFRWNQIEANWSAQGGENELIGFAKLSDLLDEIAGMEEMLAKYAPDSSLVERLSEIASEEKAKMKVLEKKGWKFNLTPDSFGHISAEKLYKYDTKPTKIGTYAPEDLPRLIKRVEEHQSDMDSLGFGKWADQGEAKEVAEVAAENKPETAENLTIEVEAQRLNDGGDIDESHSADVIAQTKSKIRQPFDWDGKLFVGVGGEGNRSGRSKVRAVQIIPAEEYTGETITYGEAHRDRPEGFYHGIAVSRGKKNYVLLGTKYTFVPKTETPEGDEKTIPADESAPVAKELTTREKTVTVEVPAAISRAEMAEQWMINGYFHSGEIEEAKKSSDPVEFLRKTGVETRRGTGGTIEGKRINCMTLTGGKVEVFFEPEKWNKTEPTFKITLKKLAQKVVEKFPKDEIAEASAIENFLGDLPLQLQEQKAEFEAKGWKFVEIDTGNWNGEKLFDGEPEPTQLFAYKSLAEILEVAQGVEFAKDHSIPLDEPAPLPPIDLELYEREGIGDGRESDDENSLSPEETRFAYFEDATRDARYIRQLEATFSGLAEKARKKTAEEIRRKIDGLGSYLVGSNNYFGKPSAEYLRGELARFDFYFDDQFHLIAESGEQLLRRHALEEKGWKFSVNSDGTWRADIESGTDGKPEKIDGVLTHAALLDHIEGYQIRLDELKGEKELSDQFDEFVSDKPALEAKYFGLIKEVVEGSENFNSIVRELEEDYGIDWALYCKETYSDAEFQEDVKDIWLGTLAGDENSLTEKFRSVVSIEPDASALPTSERHEVKFDLTDSEIVKRSSAMMSAMNELDAENRRFKAEKDKHNSNLKMIDARIQKHRNAIDTRSEFREIECALDYNFQRGTVDIIRPDTGKSIRQRPMSKEEMQKSLFKI